MGINVFRIASRVSVGLSQPLSERPDYGTRQMVSQEEETLPHSNIGQEGIIRKTPGKGYCVKSEKNPDWSGGCYPTKGEAKDRLKQIEFFKHKGSSIISATEQFLTKPNSQALQLVMSTIKDASDFLERTSTSMDDAHDAVSKTVAQGAKPRSPNSPKGAVPLTDEQDENAWNAGYEARSKLWSEGNETKWDAIEAFLQVLKLNDPRIKEAGTEGTNSSFWEWVQSVWEGAQAFEATHAPGNREASRRMASDIIIKEFNWDPGDERSYGEFRIVAKTPHGELIGHGMISSGSDTENEVWTLDGKPISPGVSYPDLGIPHFYAGDRARARFEKAKDTEMSEIISEWLSSYMTKIKAE